MPPSCGPPAGAFYTGDLDRIAKDLKATYPGYGDYIDARICEITKNHAREPAGNPIEQLSKATAAEFATWFQCAVGAAIRYLEANETADVLARVALTSCTAEEAKFREAVVVNNRTTLQTFEIVDLNRKWIGERLVALVVSSRQNLGIAKVRFDAWAECIVNAATIHAASVRETDEAVRASFFTCREREQAMRGHLVSFIGENTIVEERKAKATPILHRYVETLRSGGPRRPARPEIII
jgi:hypothetical protein